MNFVLGIKTLVQRKVNLEIILFNFPYVSRIMVGSRVEEGPIVGLLIRGKQ